MRTKDTGMHIELTGEEVSEAIGEWLAKKQTLPSRFESAKVCFEVDAKGGFTAIVTFKP